MLSPSFIPLLQTIVERLLSWPVCVVILFLSFRKPFSSLIRRLVSLKLKGVGVEGELSTSGEAKEQLELGATDPKDPLGLLGPNTQMVLPIPEDVAKRQEQVRSWGGEEPVVLNQIEALKKDLRELQFVLNTPDTTEVLIRHLATTQIIQRTETVYRLIFGSQIVALRKMRTDGQATNETLTRLYEQARNRSPRYFAQYALGDWLNFLTTNNLAISDDQGTLHITNFGVEFLTFLSVANPPRKAH